MKRNSRNGLRPITAQNYGKPLVGYFHCFCQEGSLEQGISTYAMIELENGSVHQIFATSFKFDDAD